MKLKQMIRCYSQSIQLLRQCQMINQLPLMSNDLLFLILLMTGELIFDELISNLQSANEDEIESEDEESEYETETETETDDQKNNDHDDTDTNTDTDNDSDQESDSSTDQNDPKHDEKTDTESGSDSDSDSDTDSTTEQDEEQAETEDEDDDDEWVEIKKKLKQLCSIFSFNDILTFDINEGNKFGMCLKPAVVQNICNLQIKNAMNMNRRLDSGIQINNIGCCDVLCAIKSYSWSTENELSFAYDKMLDDEDHDHVAVFLHKLMGYPLKTTWDYGDEESLVYFKTTLILEEILPLKHCVTKQKFWYIEIIQYAQMKLIG
eukprot:796304_1